MLFYDRLVHWENRKIITNQMRVLRSALRPGQKIVIDDVFKFATFVCSTCGLADHVAEECDVAMD